VVCAGQEPVRDLEFQMRANGVDPHVIGGAAIAVELDAKRASNKAPSWLQAVISGLFCPHIASLTKPLTCRQLRLQRVRRKHRECKKSTGPGKVDSRRQPWADVVAVGNSSVQIVSLEGVHNGEAVDE